MHNVSREKRVGLGHDAGANPSCVQMDRIKLVVEDIFRAEAVHRQQTSEDSDSDEDDEMSDEFDDDDDDCDLSENKMRVQMLFASLNFSEKDEMLTSVRNQLREKATTSNREVSELERLEQKQARVNQDFDVVAQDLCNEMESRKHHTLDTMNQIQTTMRHMKSKKDRRLARFARMSIEEAEQAEIEEMTEAELAAGIASIRGVIEKQEMDAGELIRDLADRQRSGGHVNLHDDVLIEQEKMVNHLQLEREDIERRGLALKQALEHVTGKATLTEDGELTMGPTQAAESHQFDEAVEEMRRISEDIQASCLPQLLAQREAEHGEELAYTKDCRLPQLEEECANLGASIHAAEGALEYLRRPESCDEDMQAKLAIVREHKQPATVLLDKVLESLSTMSMQSRLEEDGSVEERDGIALADVHDACEDLKNNIRSGCEEQNGPFHRLLEMAREGDQAAAKLRELHSEERAVQDTFELLKSHQQLFADTVSLARGAPLAGALPQPPRVSSPMQQSATVVSALAAIQGEAGVSGDGLWVDAFLGKMGDTFHKDSFDIQSDVMKAFGIEENQLGQEIEELEASLNGRVAGIFDRLEAEEDRNWLERMKECSREADQACHELASSRRALAEVGAEVVSRVVPEIAARHDLSPEKLAAMRKSVEMAHTLEACSSHALGSGGLMEVLTIEQENRVLSQRISALGDELYVLRERRAAAREQMTSQKAALKTKVEMLCKRQRSGLNKDEAEDEVLLAKLNAARGLDDVPGLQEARSLRRECRHLGAFRAEVKAMDAAKGLFSY